MRTVKATTIRVVDQDARWDHGPPRRRLAYPGRIVEVHDAEGNTIRSIACMDDGGTWVFETTGKPYPVEATFDYAALRKRDRFTSDNLAHLLSAVGPGPLTEQLFLDAPGFVLLDERVNLDAWRKQIDENATTLDDE